MNQAGAVNSQAACYHLLLQGSWQPQQVQITWRNHHSRWPEPLEREKDHHWQKVQRQHPDFFNGRLVALQHFSAQGDRLDLTLAETSYAHLLYSNRHAAEWQRNGHADWLCRALGISAVVHSRENDIILIRRSTEVGEYPNCLDVLGGHIHPQDGQTPEVFAAIAEEVRLELGIGDESIAAAQCIGLLENAANRKPELVFSMHLTLSSQAIRQAAQTAPEGHEFSEILTVPADRHRLQEMLRQRGAEFSPSAEGCLALYAQSVLSF